MPNESLRRQILLAEDNPADVYLVRQAIDEQKIHCEISVVADGEAAISFINTLDGDSQQPALDLLLLDLHLPRRDGEEVLAHLRASRRGSQTPVIILTSSDSPKLKENAERYAAVHYFRKPSTLDQFMELGGIIKEVIDAGGLSEKTQAANN